MITAFKLPRRVESRRIVARFFHGMAGLHRPRAAYWRRLRRVTAPRCIRPDVKRASAGIFRKGRAWRRRPR